MSEEQKCQPNAGGDIIQAQIGDNVQQVAIGKNITQRQQLGASIEITEGDREQIRQLFAELRKLVEQSAPTDKKSSALERVGELEDELKEGKPKVSTFEHIKSWFGRNLPALAGAVTSVLVSPIVGKIVEAGGEMAAEEFKRRMGQ